MNMTSHKRSEHIDFHSVGMADNDHFNEEYNWPMQTLDTIIADNGHSSVSDNE